MYCKNCHSQLSPTSVRCLKCGTRVPIEDLPVRNIETPKTKIRAALIILGVLILIVIIALNV